MLLANNSHLCYSLNVLPGTDWEERFRILRSFLPKLRNNLGVAPEIPFGLGLWLSAEVVRSLRKPSYLEEFRSFLEANHFYVFTVNAFPFAAFHGRKVKQQVYQPDWGSKQRLRYTCDVAEILSELLPDGMTGSISTLPGTYRFPNVSGKHLREIETNLKLSSEKLCEIEVTKGKRIVLGVEMEPDCLWESTDEFIDFYHSHLSLSSSSREHIGVCYDTCHQEVLGNKPGKGLLDLLDAGVTVAKIHLSAAILAKTADSKKVLAANFADKVYLHQTRILQSDGRILKYRDLPQALSRGNKNLPWRTHFHVPLYCEDLTGGLSAAKSELTAVLDLLRKRPEISHHLEIETYTYAVLPAEIKESSIERSIAKEYHWVVDRLKQSLT